MPPRSSWKGFIRFSLVSLPIKAYTASATGGEIHLRQLHRECNSPINYRKVCPIHGEVKQEDIVSGYEHVKGQFVVLEPEDMKKLREDGAKAVSILGFIRRGTVDPIHYAGKSHYLLPDGPIGQKPYALLHRAMVEEEFLAVAKVILSGKEQIVLLWPRDQLLAMSTLTFKTQVKDTATFQDEISDAEVSGDELRLAKTLMESSVLKDFDLASYPDTYNEKLTAVIEAKLEGKEIVSPRESPLPKVINLMDALKQSIDAAKKKVGGKGAGRKKMAPSTRKPAAARRKKKKSGA